jgi:hypothetical protein
LWGCYVFRGTIMMLPIHAVVRQSGLWGC